MRLAICLSFVLLPSLGLLSGCAAENQKPTMMTAAPAELPGITGYYAQATTHPRRAVRKPIRDQQAYALHELARSADTLLAQTRDWDSDARLVSLNDTERSDKRKAVESFRASLQGLKHAAEQSDIAALHAEYARATASYRQVSDLAGVTD